MAAPAHTQCAPSRSGAAAGAERRGHELTANGRVRGLGVVGYATTAKFAVGSRQLDSITQFSAVGPEVLKRAGRVESESVSGIAVLNVHAQMDYASGAARIKSKRCRFGRRMKVKS